MRGHTGKGAAGGGGSRRDAACAESSSVKLRIRACTAPALIVMERQSPFRIGWTTEGMRCISRKRFTSFVIFISLFLSLVLGKNAQESV